MHSRSNQYPTQALRQADAAHHLHPFTDTKSLNSEGVRVITHADGVWIWDSDGNKILDGMAGLWCTQIGHGRQEIVDAVAKQMAELDYYNTFFKTTHPAAVKLAEDVTRLAPEGFNRVFFAGSGSEANDTVLRLVRHYWAARDLPSKSIVISRHNAYHGSTMAGASLGGMTAMHKQGGLPIPDIRHIRQPYWFAEGGDMDEDEFGRLCAQALADEIDAVGSDKVAAFIGEPIQGAGGVVIPPASYWPEVNRICRERDVLLVADEVITGFGRTGAWFGSETFAIEPDIMPIAKGLSSGYLPIGGVLVHDRVAEPFIASGGEFFHGYTYSGHPACCAAAIENLHLLETEGVVEYVRDVAGPALQDRWQALGDHALVGEARMVGLVGALELVPRKPQRVRFDDEGAVGTLCRDIAVETGLVMRAVRDTMVIAPPLVISTEEIDILADRVAQTLDKTLARLKTDGRI